MRAMRRRLFVRLAAIFEPGEPQMVSEIVYMPGVQCLEFLHTRWLTHRLKSKAPCQDLCSTWWHRLQPVCSAYLAAAVDVAVGVAVSGGLRYFAYHARY